MANKVVMFCSAGMSTSLLVTKMRTEAEKQGLDLEIEAHSLNEAKKFGPEADLILLGPQVQFALEKMKERFPDVPSVVIDMRSYGLMDGKSVLELAKKYL